MHRAIETRYKGRRFRSRLEARWAVALDCLEIIWEYEPEGFELGAGLRYLPDFRLRERPVAAEAGSILYWLEIKADMPTEREQRKLKLLCEQTGGEGLFLIGQPDSALTWYCSHDRPFARLERDWWNADHFSCCRQDHLQTRDAKPHAAIQHAMSARFEFGENGTRA